MGDRGNIVIRQKDHGDVWLYTHWSGSEIEQTLSVALDKGRDRWTDPSYLSRIVFQTMLRGDDSTTGFGISCWMCDNEHPILVADCDQQKVFTVDESLVEDGKLPATYKAGGVSFEAFAAQAKELA